MRTPPVTARAVRRATGPVLLPASRFRWAARFGGLDAVTGQTGSLARAATGTATDSGFTSYTAGHSMPRWETRCVDTSTLVTVPPSYLLAEDGDLILAEDGDLFLLETGGPRLGLRMDADDLAWPVSVPVESCTILADFVELGTRTTANAALLYLGNDAQTGARLTVQGTGSNYQAILTDGTSTVTSTLATGTPASGSAARLAVQVEDGGATLRVRLLLELLGTAGVTASSWSDFLTRPAAWGTTTRLRLNRAGTTGTQGSAWFAQLAYVPGLVDVDDAGERL